MATLQSLTINDTGQLQLPSGTPSNRPTNTPTIIRWLTSGATVVTGSTPAGLTSSNFTCPTGVTQVEVLVVAGGGGGGHGGGGAGGVIYRSNYPVVPGTNYAVSVGTGGARGQNAVRGQTPAGSNGGNSSFDALIAIGGGGGSQAGAANASSGGSGGGQGGDVNTATRASGTAGQGHRGGRSTRPGYGAAGGGGGAGGPGEDSTEETSDRGRGGNGGPGLAFNILGNPQYFGGGGGGGSNTNSVTTNNGGLGGVGGGGNGARIPDAGLTNGTTAGTDGLGGGGGGAEYEGSIQGGGAGGSGTVIIRYWLDASSTIPVGNLRVNTWSNTLESFDNDGWNFDHSGNGITTNGLRFYIDGARYGSAAGSTVLDLSPSRYNSTIVGGVTYSTTFGGIFTFDGTSGYMDATPPSGYTGTGFWTMSAWFRVNGAPSDTLYGNYIIDTDATGGSANAIFVRWSDMRLQYRSRPSTGGGYTDVTGSVLTIGVWYHVSVVRYGDVVTKVFLNGNLDASYVGNVPTATQPLVRLGRWTDGTVYGNVSIGAAMVYDRALSIEEIQRNHNAFRNRFNIGNIKIYSSALQIKQENPDAESGLYWIQYPTVNSSGVSSTTFGNGANVIEGTPFAGAQLIYCDMEFDGGGWMLVASNDARDTTIPGGTSRYSADYELDRPYPLIGTQGISPNGDYIIGRMIQHLPFTQVRVWAWGRGDLTGTYNQDYRATEVKAIWTVATSGPDRLTEIRPRAEVTVTGMGGSGNLSGNASYFVLDGVKADRINGGFSSNSNQITIGGTGTAGGSGDPTTGTYLGHGITEGSYEGWYDAANNVTDCQGYTTWVR